MNRDEAWIQKYEEVLAFIKTNKRNPSKYDARERGLYCTWLKYNRKVMNAEKLKPERVEKFKKLIELMEKYRRKNQYESEFKSKN